MRYRRYFAVWTTAVIVLLTGALPRVAAHSVIESAEPAASSVVDEPVSTLVMNFNTSLEPVSVEVADADGKEMPIRSTEANGKTLTAQLEEPIADNGVYTVRWHIIGADGHAIKGEYAFEIRMPEPPASQPAGSAPPASESAVSESPPASAPSPPPTATSSPEASPAEDDGGGSGSGIGFADVILIVAAVVLVGAVGYVLLSKRKK